MKTTKRFDKRLFEENDTQCRNRVKELFNGTKYVIEDNPKRYGVDLLVKEGDDVVFYIETERKMLASWNDEKFPYDDIQLPERKSKFCSLDKPVYFIMFNHDFGNFLTFSSETVLTSPQEQVYNKYNNNGKELFFKIPVDKVTFNSIQMML